MPAAYPRLRDDLPTSRQQTADGEYYVLKDPRSGRFFRFRDTEYFIARQLDGATPPDVVRQKLEAEYGVSVPPQTLTQFIAQLGQLELLQGHCAERRSTGNPLVRGSVLYLRLRAFDPDRLLDTLIARLGFFFTPAFLALSATAIALAFAITVANWTEISRDMGRLYRFDALLLAWISVLTVTALHEFAHGLTCKRFGGEVHEMGFLLLYFQPAFYCNISDAWLFPKRSQRMWVTFAGGYFEAFLWALATLAWRLTEPATGINFVALVVMATSGIKFMFNANPLIKLDGYYLLSDYLDIPNLRQRSFAYLRDRWRRAPADANTTRRERRVYVLYGVLAAVYSAWLLGMISWHFGNFLVGRYQTAGLLLFAFFLAALFQQPLARLLGRFKRVGDAQARGRWPFTRGRRVAAAAVLLAALAFVPLELKVAGDFTVRPAHNADVRAQVEGMVAEVFVDEGDTVAKGQPLVRLSDRDQRSQLETVDAAIEEKRARLRMLQAGATIEEKELARAELAAAATKRTHAQQRYDEAVRFEAARLSRGETAVKAAEERLDYTKRDAERVRELYRLGLVSRSQLDDHEQQMRLRQRELEQARDERTLTAAGDTAQLRQELALAAKEVDQAAGRLKLVLAGSRAEVLDATEAEIAQLEARRQYLQQQLALLTVLSPAPGVVVTPRLKETVGRHVGKGDLILEVYGMADVTPEIFVSEKDVADLTPGQTVALKARAYPEKTFFGTVASIAPAAMQAGDLGARGFRVRVALGHGADLLKPEMTGMAKISCGKRSILALSTRRVARLLRVEFWSFW